MNTKPSVRLMEVYGHEVRAGDTLVLPWGPRFRIDALTMFGQDHVLAHPEDGGQAYTVKLDAQHWIMPR